MVRPWPPNYITSDDGYRYRLERWHYNNDYTMMLAEYVPDDDIPYIDQKISRSIPV